MKYTTEIVIALPRETVLEKIENPDYRKHWQKGLLEASLISGEEGKEGAKTKLTYKLGKRTMEMVETIMKRNPPQEFHALYTTDCVYNTQENFFEETPDGKTRWTSHNEFKFSGLGLKIMAFLMPKSFKKQSLQYMGDFKAFAEDGKSVAITS